MPAIFSWKAPVSDLEKCLAVTRFITFSLVFFSLSISFFFHRRVVHRKRKLSSVFPTLRLKAHSPIFLNADVLFETRKLLCGTYVGYHFLLQSFASKNFFITSEPAAGSNVITSVAV